MLESTGSHGRDVERRVSEMRRMVEFNCTFFSDQLEQPPNPHFKVTPIFGRRQTHLGPQCIDLRVHYTLDLLTAG